MTDNKEYANIIKEILLKAVEAESWGDMEMMARIPVWRSQLGMAHKSFLSAIGYDAAYNIMSSSERKKIAEGLKRLAVEPALGDWLIMDLILIREFGRNVRDIAVWLSMIMPTS